MPRVYTNANCLQFVKDMESAGLEVQHYQGRSINSYRGPGVIVDEIDRAVSKTNVKCQLRHDSMGDGYIIHPVDRDEGVEQGDTPLQKNVGYVDRHGDEG
jgi:hypothetical protein